METVNLSSLSFTKRGKKFPQRGRGRGEASTSANDSQWLKNYFWTYNHGPKSWDTFAFLGRFPIHTGLTLPLTQQTMLDACIQNFFRVSTFCRVGGGKTARKFRKGCIVLRGCREMTENYKYCSTVPRTFVQDCSFQKENVNLWAVDDIPRTKVSVFRFF